MNRFTVTVLGDARAEGTVILSLSAPVRATLGVPQRAVPVIEDNSLYLPVVMLG